MSPVQFWPEAPFAGIAHLAERHLAKVEVASSNLVARSIWRHSQVVRQGTANPRLLQFKSGWRLHFFSGRRDRGGLKNFIRSGIEAVITGRSRKPLAFTGTWVRIPPTPPRQNNTKRSSAAAGGVRLTDGVVFPFQIGPAALGSDLVLRPFRYPCGVCFLYLLSGGN